MIELTKANCIRVFQENPQWWPVRLYPEALAWIGQSGSSGHWACAKVFNVCVNLGSPCLDSFIESKTRKESTSDYWSLAVSEDELVDEFVYVLSLKCLLPDWMVVVGVASGKRIRADGVKKKKPNGPNFLTIEYEKLTAPSQLHDVLRQKQRNRSQAKFFSNIP